MSAFLAKVQKQVANLLHATPVEKRSIQRSDDDDERECDIIIATIDIRKAYLQFLIRDSDRKHLGYYIESLDGEKEFYRLRVAMFGLAS